MLTQVKAENNIRKWFWAFKHKLVDDYPEYTTKFNSYVTKASESKVLYEVMEFAYMYLEVKSDLEGVSTDKLDVGSYVEAFDYGYKEWVNH